jgi:alpha-glucoside transport system permease protein
MTAPATPLAPPLEAPVKPMTPTQRVVAFFSRGIVQLILVVIALLWMMPTAGLLITSLRQSELYGVSGWWEALVNPSQLTIDNYSGLLTDQSLIQAVISSFSIAIPSTLLPVILAAMAGYALAVMPFKGRDALFLVVIGMLVVPLQMALLPASAIFRNLGIGGLPAIWLFHTAFGLPFAIFLMRNYYAGIPTSLIEAARIDGAGEWTIFRKVILPLGFPALAALTIFQFTWTWNDLLVALVFASDQEPMTLFLRNRLGEFSSGIGIISPGVFISAVIPLIIFFAFQKYFEAGLLGGSVK